MLLKLKIILILVLTIFSIELKAQSLQFVTSDTKAFALPNETVKTVFATFKNISKSKITLKAMSEPIKLAGDHQAAFCFGTDGVCYAPSSSKIVSGTTYILGPDSTSTKSAFYGQLFFGSEGTSQVRYTIFNANDANDKISIDVTFVISVLGGVGEDAVEKIIFSIVNSQNNLTLNVPDYLIYKKFSIYDSKGNSVISSAINSNQTNLNISNLFNGIYFIKFDGVEKSIQFSVVR